jgi:hypothetical protein
MPKKGKVVFVREQTRNLNNGMGHIEGRLVRITDPAEKEVIEYWTTETIGKLRKRYRKLIEMET